MEGLEIDLQPVVEEPVTQTEVVGGDLFRTIGVATGYGLLNRVQTAALEAGADICIKQALRCDIELRACFPGNGIERGLAGNRFGYRARWNDDGCVIGSSRNRFLLVGVADATDDPQGRGQAEGRFAEARP